MMEGWSERQEEIMDQAVLLIAHSGIQGLTVRNLAKAIGVSEPALYRHFDSKTDILLGILDRFDRASQGMRTTLSSENSPGLEQLKFFLEASLSRFQQRPEITAVIFAEEIFQNEPRLTEKVADIMRKHQASLLALLTGGQACGTIRDDVPAEGLTLLIQGSIRLLVSRWRMANYGFDLVAEGRGLSEVLRTLLTHNK
jgi:TetR/AcrR family transcriptional regulator, fatty acid metabolism regulator protein